MKLEKKRINQNYIPLLAHEIIVDSVILFDIYIKKSNGYVVIIEANSTITSALKVKISNIGKIYIQKAMLNTYSKYRKKHQEQDDFHIVPVEAQLDENIDKACRKLRLYMSSDASYKKKVEEVLSCGYALMKTCYGVNENVLFLEHISIYAKTLIYIVSSSGINIKQFIALMREDNSNETHAVNVAIIAIYLADILEFSDYELQCIFQAGLLHDLGNKLMDYEILNEHGKLSVEQFKTIQEHPRFGSDMVKEAGINDKQILEAILYHHENLDGSGYPLGLKGAKIPKMAQVIGLCDVFNALTMERSYRASYSSFDALKIIKLEMKGQFNILYINKLIKMLH